MSDEKTKKPRKATGTIELGHLIKLANAGKPRALENAAPPSGPASRNLAAGGRARAKSPSMQLVTTILQTNQFGRGAIKRKLADLRAELEGPRQTSSGTSYVSIESVACRGRCRILTVCQRLRR